MTSARHRGFIGPRLLGSFAILACFPLYVVVRGAPGALEVFCFAWLVAPIAISYFLSRTGEFETAHALSSIALAILITGVALNSGGIASFAAVWLVAVAIEGALSTSRRVIAFSIALSLICAGFLTLVGYFGLLPESFVTGEAAKYFGSLGIASVIAYCSALAFFVQRLGHTSRGLLNAEENRYRLLARNMSDVISRHRRNGAIEFISPAAASVFGVPVSELSGHGLFDRVHVADRPAYLSAFADVARGVLECEVEFRVKRETKGEDGRPVVNFVWIEMRCRPLAKTDSSVDAEVVAVMRDISDRKGNEQALELAREETERAHAAKSQFLATMSHELRTPLNAIIGFSEMIVQEKELNIDAAHRREYAQLINDSGQHLLSVVNSILDMSKMESGGFEISADPFQPREAIVNCCNLMALKAREGGVDLVVRAPEHLPTMIGDERALKQIMLNLLSNAIKFTERGGSVTVSAEVDGDNLSLRVTDTGVGISMDDLKRIGDPFFQAEKTYRRRHEGTGLGLSIVKSLVGLHQGEMQLESRIDEGTTVSIVLPLNVDTAPRKTTVTKLAPRQAERIEQRIRKSA